MKEILILKEPIGKITEAKQVFNKVKKINVDYTQENFIILCLNTKNQIIKAEVLFKGGLDACLIDPKIIFRYALLNNSSKIIIAHNHPSKSLEPSNEDRNIYKKLKDLGEELDLKVLDSIIFNKKEFYSLDE